MNKLQIHLEAGCKPVAYKNVIHYRSRRRLVLCDCGQKYFASAIDIAEVRE